MSALSEQLKERRLSRMRLGKAVAEIRPLLSDPEIQLAIVPLTESEYLNCLTKTVALDLPDNIAGASMRDRHNTNELLVRALRDPEDLTKRPFSGVDELTESLNVEDINFLMEAYWQMMAEVSPSVEMLSDADIEELKKVLGEIDWKGITGKQCYALKNFLSTLGLMLLPDNTPGSLSTSLSTLTNERDESTPSVSPNTDNSLVKSAGSP
jgi:hypothetical protein